MPYLNWARSIFRKELSPSSSILIPITLDDAIARGEPVPPPGLDFDLGLYFEYEPTVDANGDVTGGTFLLDENGYKIPRYLTSYSTTQLGDSLILLGYPKFSGGTFLNAIDTSIVRLGDGDDSFVIDGIGALTAAEININAAGGGIYRSYVFGDGGNDYVQAYIPWDSFFDGGANDPYPAGAPTTVGALPPNIVQGDEIWFNGSRGDWDFEFRDQDGDGVVTLESLLDPTRDILVDGDYILLSNNNRVRGFERLDFYGSPPIDLILSSRVDQFAQLDQFQLFGNPDYYYISVDDPAPELNSSMAPGSGLWAGLGFSRTPLLGIAGLEASPVEVHTGDRRDTPLLTGGAGLAGLRFATLATEAGGDIVQINGIEDAVVDLGIDDDRLTVTGLIRKGVLLGGSGIDVVELESAVLSSVDVGAGNDVVKVGADVRSVVFEGGVGDGDEICLPGDLDSYGFYYLSANDQFVDLYGNSYSGFELFSFVGDPAEGPLSKDQLIARVPQLSPVGSSITLEGPQPVDAGDSALYASYLSNGIEAGGSIRLGLSVGGVSAVPGEDFQPLTESLLLPGVNFTLETLDSDPLTGDLSLLVTNSSGRNLAAGSNLNLFSFSIATSVVAFDVAPKLYEVRATTLPGGVAQAVQTAIFSPESLLPPSSGNDGGLVLPDLPARPEIPAPPPELADDADQDLSPPDGGQLITKGPVRDGVQILVGTAFKDVLVGGLGPDFLDGGASSDTYTGGPEQDVFRRLYADPDPDVITDFAAGGDRVQIGAVPLLSSLGRRLNGRTQWKKALAQTSGLKAGKSSRAFFVHQRSSGRIYFNANRTDRGWGREGGLVVTIPAGEPFSWKDLQFDYGTASSADSLASLL